MFKLTYKDEVFTIKNYEIYDSTDVIVDEALATEIAQYYVKSLNFNDMQKDIVFGGIKFAYKHKDYEDVPKLIRIYFDREDVESSEKKLILPKLAEVYRKLGESKKAINLFNYLREFYGDYLLSSEFIAQIAHALCDLRDYENAKITCEWAYTLRKPNLEVISEVYNRIQSESSDFS